MWSYSNRLTLFWDTPIYAGVFLSLLYAGVASSMLHTHRRILYIQSAAIIPIATALALTQTRSAIIAALLSTFTTVLCALSKKTYSMREATKLFLISLLPLITATSIVTPERIKIDSVTSDQSVRNRIEIWNSCLDLLWLEPWSGLGKDEAAYTYSQFYQTGEKNYLYNNVYNEYLKIGVEHGIPLLFFLILFVALLVLAPLADNTLNTCESKKATIIKTCSYGVFLSFAINCHFNNIFNSIACSLLGVVAAIMTAFISLGVYTNSPRQSTPKTYGILAAAFILSIAAILALCIMRHYKALSNNVYIEKNENAKGWILNKRHEKDSAAIGRKSAVVLIDQVDLGPLFGKWLKKYLLASPSFSKFIVLDPRYKLDNFASNEITNHAVIYFGNSYLTDETNSLFASATKIIIDPKSYPSISLKKSSAKVIIWLKNSDQFSNHERWKQDAKSHNWIINKYFTNSQLVLTD